MLHPGATYMDPTNPTSVRAAKEQFNGSKAA